MGMAGRVRQEITTEASEGGTRSWRGGVGTVPDIPDEVTRSFERAPEQRVRRIRADRLLSFHGPVRAASRTSTSAGSSELELGGPVRLLRRGTRFGRQPNCL